MNCFNSRYPENIWTRDINSDPNHGLMILKIIVNVHGAETQ